MTINILTSFNHITLYTLAYNRTRWGWLTTERMLSLLGILININFWMMLFAIAFLFWLVLPCQLLRRICNIEVNNMTSVSTWTIEIDHEKYWSWKIIIDRVNILNQNVHCGVELLLFRWWQIFIENLIAINFLFAFDNVYIFESM